MSIASAAKSLLKGVKQSVSAAGKAGKLGKGVLEFDATKVLWALVSFFSVVPILAMMALALLVIIILMNLFGSTSTMNPDPSASGSLSPAATALIAAFGGDGTGSFGEDRVPDPSLVGPIKEAAKKCTLITPVIIAAQIDYASGWNAAKVGPDGRRGLSQLTPEVFDKFGKNESADDDENDDDDEEKGSPLDPEDNMHAHARYFCHLAEEVDKLISAGKVAGDRLSLTLMAWELGLKQVEQMGGMPAVDPTSYAMNIRKLFAGYTGTGTVAPTPTTKVTGGAKVVVPPADTGPMLERALTHINAARTAEGLTPLTLDAGLSSAAAVHTRLMIDGCGLEHQCVGEAGLGDRIGAQGVQWSGVGENIGFGSSGASEAEMVSTANGLTTGMLAEVPPEDGHRKNLLNPGFGRVGLSIIRDSNGLTWLTQDFAN